MKSDEETIALIKNANRWCSPFLHVKRLAADLTTEWGVIFSGDRTSVYSLSLEGRMKYDSVESIVEDGWEVD